MGDVASLSRTGGWAIELQAFFLFTAVAVALLGPGRYAINRR
jgi:putative oxidoreductase